MVIYLPKKSENKATQSYCLLDNANIEENLA